MPISPVELYEQLKPRLGEDETKSLIEYMDAKVNGEVATKEDLLLLKSDLQKEMQGIRVEMQGIRSELKEEIQGVRAEFKEEIWKLRVLVIVVLVLVVVLNPKVVELVGKIFEVAK